MKKYEDPYYLVRKLKPYVNVKPSIKTIYIPQGKQLIDKSQKYIDLLVNNFNYQIQTEIDVPNFTIILLARSIGIAGVKIHFLQHKFFELVPGTNVSKIGNGKATAVNYIDKFSMPYEYSGAIYIENIKHYAFKIPDALKPDKSRDFYMLYTKDKYKVYRKIFRKNNTEEYTRIFLPKFKINW